MRTVSGSDAVALREQFLAISCCYFKGEKSSNADVKAPPDYTKHNVISDPETALLGRRTGSSYRSLDGFSSSFYNQAGFVRWMLPTYSLFADALAKPLLARLVQGLTSLFSSKSAGTVGKIEHLPRIAFEIVETRNFLAEVLRMLDKENGRHLSSSNWEEPEYEDDEVSLIFSCRSFSLGKRAMNNVVTQRCTEIGLLFLQEELCEKIKYNLVRADYLKPSRLRQSAKKAYEDHQNEQRVRRERRKVTRELQEAAKSVRHNADRAAEKQIPNSAGRLATKSGINGAWYCGYKYCDDGKCKCGCCAGQCGPTNGCSCEACFALLSPVEQRKVSKLLQVQGVELDADFYDELEEILGTGYQDMTLFRHMHTISNRMWAFRFFAFFFGVLPEVLTLIMIIIAGVQYILWCGYKVPLSRSLGLTLLLTFSVPLHPFSHWCFIPIRLCFSLPPVNWPSPFYNLIRSFTDFYVFVVATRLVATRKEWKKSSSQRSPSFSFTTLVRGATSLASSNSCDSF